MREVNEPVITLNSKRLQMNCQFLEPLSSVLTLLPLVSYNTFDLEILQDFASSPDVELSGVQLHMDAMRLATNMLNSGGKLLKLVEACDDCRGRTYQTGHNVLGDVQATAHLMHKLFRKIREDDLDDQRW